MSDLTPEQAADQMKQALRLRDSAATHYEELLYQIIENPIADFDRGKHLTEEIEAMDTCASQLGYRFDVQDSSVVLASVNG